MKRVRGSSGAPPAGSAPSVIALEPALGASAAAGGVQIVTATVYDAAGSPLSGVALTLGGDAPLASVPPLASVTDAQGRLSFQLQALLALNGAWTAQAGGLQSNSVRVVWLP